MKSLFRISLIPLVLTIFSCEQPDNGDGDGSIRAETIAQLLKNWSENNVSNAFSNAEIELNILQEEVSIALDDNIIDSLEIISIQAVFKAAWLAFAQLGPFNYGPADNYLLIAYGNTFPTDTALINENILSGNTNLDPVSQIDAQGFPALDYLINHHSELNESQSSYLEFLLNRIDNLLSTTSEEFQSSSYQIAFQENNGSDINSSIAVATNAMIKEFEVIKNPRIGIPLGKKTLGQQRPEQVESLFGQYSLDLAIANWESIQSIYFGSFPRNSASTGLDDLLEEDLKSDIENQINLITESFEAIPTNNLQLALENHVEELNSLHDAIQGLVVLWKTDMMSTLGLQINYQDNDGD